MSVIGTTRTFSDVRFPVAIGGKADFEQAASNKLSPNRI
jgi:hypothetical protein